VKTIIQKYVFFVAFLEVRGRPVMILASTLETLLNPKVKKIWCRKEF
jgi:hypothetical protein